MLWLLQNPKVQYCAQNSPVAEKNPEPHASGSSETMTYLAQSATVFQLQGQHKVKLFNER
jgi:hypothetical protein